MPTKNEPAPLDKPLSRADKKWLADLTTQIRTIAGRVSSDLIQVGRIIGEAKARLPHGAFGDWCAAELPWSPNTVLRLFRAAEVFAPKNAKLADLTSPVPRHIDRIEPSALHVLSAPSCPAAAVETAIAAAKSGERITYTRAREIVAEAKGEPKKRETSPPPGQDMIVDRLDAMVTSGKIRLTGEPNEDMAEFMYVTYGEYRLLAHCLFPENFTHDRPLDDPTDTAPGSDARLKVMLRRAAAGLALEHPDDAAPGKNGETRNLVIVNRSGGAGQVTSDGRAPPPPKVVCFEGEEDRPENRKWFRKEKKP